MIGLEKVTGKILADAEQDAREILEAADAECAAITARYRAEAEAEQERLREEHDRECTAVILRAKSSAAMVKRNALLEARAAVLDEAYAAAEKQIRSMTGEPYLELLTKMLRTAIKDQLAGEEESLRLYGENIAPERYEILLSERDRSTYGERLLESFRRGLGSKFPARVHAALTLAQEPAAIDGGLILRCGPVETNCSLSMLLAENRRETEVRVSHILFGE